jgi:tetratricopeptide (TPR) repeat protein
MTEERSARALLWQQLFRCPHRRLEEAKPTFEEVLERDPLFAGHAFHALALSTGDAKLEGLLPSYQKAFKDKYPSKERFNAIRDLGELGCAHLLTSPYRDHREAGRCDFQLLEPYRAGRVAFYIRGHLKVNRQVQGAIRDYLRALEANERRFDGAVLRARKTLHHLYEFFHVKPSARAQAVLFDEEPPPGSLPYLVKVLAKVSDPTEQAKLIAKHKLPYTVATAAIKHLTPAVVVALIETMRPVEAVNARGWLERQGWLRDERIKALYLEKVEQAARDKRASVAAMKERASAKGRDEAVEAAIQQAREAKLREGARIERDTLLAVDVSGSMHASIEIAQRLGALIAPLCDGELRVICFREYPEPLPVKGPTLRDWEEAFEKVKADGSTSLGCALEKAVREGFLPAQAIFITDQEENSPPRLAQVYRRLLEQGHDLIFVFLNVRSPYEVVSQQLEAAGARVAVFHFEEDLSQPGWYVSLEQLIPVLTGEGPIHLVDRLLALELPARPGVLT